MNKRSSSPRTRYKLHSASPAPRKVCSRSPDRVRVQEEPLLEEKLCHNRQKLIHTLDTYTMLIRSNNPIRCLEHNCVVSVYCENDNKLLCSNCMLGKVEHKFHKMTPIDKCEPFLRERLPKMCQSVEKEVKAISDTSALILKNLIQEETEAHKILNSLTQRFREAHQLLDDWFQATKNFLIEGLKEIKIKHQTVALELCRLKDVYLDYLSPQMDTHKNSSLHLLFYRHVVLRTINKQNKFENSIRSLPEPKFRSLGHQELNKITHICNQLGRKRLVGGFR